MAGYVNGIIHQILPIGATKKIAAVSELKIPIAMTVPIEQQNEIVI